MFRTQRRDAGISGCTTCPVPHSPAGTPTCIMTAPASGLTTASRSITLLTDALGTTEFFDQSPIELLQSPDQILKSSLKLTSTTTQIAVQRTTPTVATRRAVHRGTRPENASSTTQNLKMLGKENKNSKALLAAPSARAATGRRACRRHCGQAMLARPGRPA